MKTYLVFGAAGSIGSEVVRQLLAVGHRVIASVRNTHQGPRGAIVALVEDVADREELEMKSNLLCFDNKLDGIIYAVGHCPPGEFSEAIKYPLSQLPLEKYMREIDMHQVGVLNVFQCMLKNLADGGCFVFISSAITRLKGNFPPFLHVHYHASVVSAEDWLIDGMRHDPMVVGRKIKVHRIAPAAVDTPFHHGGPKPPKLIPLEEVARAIVLATQSDEVMDKELL